MSWWSGLLLVGAMALTGAYLSAAISGWLAAWDGLRPRWDLIPAATMAPVFGAVRQLRRPSRRLEKSDTLLWVTAPSIAALSVTLSFAVIPLAQSLIATDLSLGLFYFVVILGPLMVALMNAGWGTNGKLGVLVAFRACAHIVAYEVTFGFAVIGPAMMAQSLSTVQIVEAQSRVWFALLQPGSFALFLASALFVTYRYPFDLPFAGDELAGGALREYSGVQKGLVEFARHALLAATAAIGAITFLGGWLGPVLPGPVWVVLKTVLLILLLSAGPLLVPRLRQDQMLAFSWKILVPFALGNILLVALVTSLAVSFRLLP